MAAVTGEKQQISLGMLFSYFFLAFRFSAKAAQVREVECRVLIGVSPLTSSMSYAWV